jgi:hypothetical protein
MVKVVELTEDETKLLKVKSKVGENLVFLVNILSEQIKNNKEEFWEIVRSEHPEIPTDMMGLVDKSTEPWRVIFQRYKDEESKNGNQK